MADFVNLEIAGLAEMLRTYAALAALTPETLGVVSAMTTEAETMMTLSKRSYAPVASGTLRASGEVDPPRVTGDEAEVTLGYGGAARRYAFRVHENPRTGQTGGFSPTGRRYPSKRWSRVGQWKFLETPVMLRRQAYFDAIGEAAAAAIARRVGG